MWSVQKKPNGTKLPLFRNEWERGFGTKKVANTERPGHDLGSTWHLLSGEGVTRAGGQEEPHPGGSAELTGKAK